MKKTALILSLFITFSFASQKQDPTQNAIAQLEAYSTTVLNAVGAIQEHLKDFIDRKQTFEKQIAAAQIAVNAEQKKIDVELQNQKSLEDQINQRVDKLTERYGNLPLRFKWRYEVMKALNAGESPSSIARRYTYTAVSARSQLLQQEEAINRKSLEKLIQALNEITDLP